MIIVKVKDLVIGLGISMTKLASSLNKKNVQADVDRENARISTTKLKALKNVTANRPPSLPKPAKPRDTKEERITYAKVTQTRLEALSAHLNKSQEFTIDQL